MSPIVPFRKSYGKSNALLPWRREGAPKEQAEKPLTTCHKLLYEPDIFF